MELDPPAGPAEARRDASPGLLERLRSARPGATHPTERYIGSLR